MRKNMKAAFMLRNGELFTMLIIMAITALVAIVTGALTSSFALEFKEWLYLCATPIAVYPFINIFLKAIFLVDETAKGLSFGMTRRTFFITNRIYDLIEVVVITLLAIAILGRDYAILIILGAVVYFGLIMWVEALVGNNVIRYGKIFYGIYYVSVIVLLIAGPKLLLHAGFESTIGEIVKSLVESSGFPIIIWAITGLFILLGLGCNWLTFRKIPINTNF